jgi:hypothetical protein
MADDVSIYENSEKSGVGTIYEDGGTCDNESIYEDGGESGEDIIYEDGARRLGGGSLEVRGWGGK